MVYTTSFMVIWGMVDFIFYPYYIPLTPTKSHYLLSPSWVAPFVRHVQFWWFLKSRETPKINVFICGMIDERSIYSVQRGLNFMSTSFCGKKQNRTYLACQCLFSSSWCWWRWQLRPLQLYDPCPKQNQEGAWERDQIMCRDFETFLQHIQGGATQSLSAACKTLGHLPQCFPRCCPVKISRRNVLRAVCHSRARRGRWRLDWAPLRDGRL